MVSWPLSFISITSLYQKLYLALESLALLFVYGCGWPKSMMSLFTNILSYCVVLPVCSLLIFLCHFDWDFFFFSCSDLWTRPVLQFLYYCWLYFLPLNILLVIVTISVILLYLGQLLKLPDSQVCCHFCALPPSLLSLTPHVPTILLFASL